MILHARIRLASLLTFSLAAGALALPACAPAGGDDAEALDEGLRGATPIATILAGVPAGTPWAALSPKKKRQLEHAARTYLARVRHDWGTKGLDEKEARLLDGPSPAMIENYDRIVGWFVASEVPATFKASSDVKSPALAAQLKRLYLAWCATHRDILPSTNPEFRDWDGGAVREMLVVDDETLDQQKAFVRDVEAKLVTLQGLEPQDHAIRNKVLFFTRQMKRGTTGFNLGADDLHQTGGAATRLYDFATSYRADGTGVILKEDDLLQALNAMTFLDQKWTNVGTVDAFQTLLGQFTDPGFLAEVGFDPKTLPVAAHYTTLAKWWGERTSALPDATRRCTVYDKADREALWDGFTATNLYDAEGKTTLESYAASYVSLASANLDGVKRIANAALDAAFPPSGADLTAAQRASVRAAIQATTKPAAMVATVTAALDAATGKPDASKRFSDALGALTVIGGSYAPGDAVSAADKAIVDAMWNDVRAFVKAHYSGYDVDTAALLPPTVSVTTGGSSFTGTAPGQAFANVSIGIGRPWSKASLYATMLHEGKHAIDIASKAPIQGATWEGGGLATEVLVGDRFVAEVMASESTKLPFYALARAVDDVRLTATTDATLKVLLRKSCTANEPTSIDFVKGIIAGYGYDSPDTQLARSRRAHQGTQYLSYELGRVVMIDVVKFLQTEVGPGTVVDPLLLQACNLSTAKPDAASATALKACIARKK